jgi:hypothetical protein
MVAIHESDGGVDARSVEWDDGSVDRAHEVQSYGRSSLIALQKVCSLHKHAFDRHDAGARGAPNARAPFVIRIPYIHQRDQKSGVEKHMFGHVGQASIAREPGECCGREGPLCLIQSTARRGRDKGGQEFAQAAIQCERKVALTPESRYHATSGLAARTILRSRPQHLGEW